MRIRFPSRLLLVAIATSVILGSPASTAARTTRISLGSDAQVTAPALRRPLDERRFDFEEPAEGVVEISWDECRGAALYRVQVSEKEDFSEPLNRSHQLVLVDRETRVEFVGLPAGGYYVLVAAIDGEGRQGSWSPLRRFSVNQGAPPPAGEGPALVITDSVPAGAMVIVHGTTAPGVRVEASVNGVRSGEIIVGEGGAFSMMVEANSIGQNSVELLAIDKSGRSSTAATSFYYGG